MDRLTRIIVYGSIGLVLAVAGLIIAFFVVNAKDEALSAEAARMLERPANPYAAAENLTVALAGMDALLGESIIAAGEKALAEHDRIAVLPSKERKAAHDKAQAESPGRLRVAGAFDCRPAVQSCWNGVDARRGEHRAQREANAELYRRYLQLHAMRGYFDATQPSQAYAPMWIPAPVRSIFVEDVALRVKDARSARERSLALSDLDRDIRTWRAMLTGQGAVVSKFVALYHLHGDYALLADMLGDRRIDSTPHFREIETMLSHVTADDWNITGALDYEFRVIAAAFDELDREKGLADARSPGEKAPWWQWVVSGDLSSYFKPNATKNLAARHMLEVKRLAQADGSAYTAEREKLRRWREEHLARGLGYFHNPFGRYLVALVPASYDDYPLRAHDIAGFHRLVRLGFEARRQGVADDAMPAFIRLHAWAAHPVSAEPFAWDATRRELAMTPLAPQNKERRFRIPVK